MPLFNAVDSEIQIEDDYIDMTLEEYKELLEDMSKLQEHAATLEAELVTLQEYTASLEETIDRYVPGDVGENSTETFP